jgi:hypothetical protein
VVARYTDRPHDGNTAELGIMRRAALFRLFAGFVTLFTCCARSHEVGIGGARDAGGGVSVMGDASGPQMDPTEYGLCARFAAIQCAAEERCCSAPTRSADRCVSDQTQNCAQTVYLDQIAMSPVSGFDANAVEAVFTELEQRTERCDLSVATWALSDEGLRGLFRGTLMLDQSCSPVGGVSGERGVVAAALSSCRHADGLACLPRSLIGAWNCAPKQPAGQTCITDDNCERTAACNNFSQPGLGNCVTRMPLGAACTVGSQCESFYCDGKSCATADVQAVYCLPP